MNRCAFEPHRRRDGLGARGVVLASRSGVYPPAPLHRDGPGVFRKAANAAGSIAMAHKCFSNHYHGIEPEIQYLRPPVGMAGWAGFFVALGRMYLRAQSTADSVMRQTAAGDCPQKECRHKAGFMLTRPLPPKIVPVPDAANVAYLEVHALVQWRVRVYCNKTPVPGWPPALMTMTWEEAEKLDPFDEAVRAEKEVEAKRSGRRRR